MSQKTVFFSLSMFLILVLVMGRIYWTDNIFTAFTEYTKAPEVVETEEPKTKLTNLSSDKLWLLIQGWRKSQNLTEFIQDERLCDIANKRSVEIQTTYSHDKFISDYSNYKFQLQENINTCTDEQMCLDKWLNSPPHKKTLQKWSYSCVKCNNWHCVQIFSNF